jgi:homoaconitase/3-isopropylmalate dehydratase large subunit
VTYLDGPAQRVPGALGGMIAPGELIAMGDSHSTSGGVFNACVTNSAMDALYILAFGELWFRVPESIKVVIDGRPRVAVRRPDKHRSHGARLLRPGPAQYRAA